MGQQWALQWAPRALIGTIVPQGQHIIENSLKPAVCLLQWAQRALIEPIDPQGQQSIENRPKPAFCLLQSHFHEYWIEVVLRNYLSY